VYLKNCQKGPPPMAENCQKGRSFLAINL